MIDNHIVVHEPTFTITDIKPYAPVVILSTQDNAKLLEQFKSSFKRTINRNKYEPQVAVQEQNWYLDFLVTPSFQEVNRLFVLSFQYTNCRIILFHLLKKRVQYFDLWRKLFGSTNEKQFSNIWQHHSLSMRWLHNWLSLIVHLL